MFYNIISFKFVTEEQIYNDCLETMRINKQQVQVKACPVRPNNKTQKCFTTRQNSRRPSTACVQNPSVMSALLGQSCSLKLKCPAGVWEGCLQGKSLCTKLMFIFDIGVKFLGFKDS